MPKDCAAKSINVQKIAIASALKSEDKIATIIEQADLARETYKAGDIEQAKSAADRVIFQAQTLPDEDKQKLSPDRVNELNDSLEDMFVVQEGVYRFDSREEASRQGEVPEDGGLD